MPSFEEQLREWEESEITLDKICEEIQGDALAMELGLTRMGISKLLKRAIKKVFGELKKMNPDMDAFEIAVALANGFNQQNQMKSFFDIFPKDIKSEIEKAARDRYPKFSVK